MLHKLKYRAERDFISTYAYRVNSARYIDLLMIGRYYLAWGIAFFTATVGLIIASVQPQLCEQRSLLHITSILMFLGAIYGATEAFRIATWKDQHYHESDGTMDKPPPENLIKIIIKRVVKQS